MGKLLAIYGSPRENGRSEKALNILLKNVEAERLYIRNKNIKPCSGCLECSKNGICNIKDDMEEVIASLISSDIIILSSPVYFKGIPSHLKAMIDRCQVLWNRKIEKKALGFFILTCEKKENFPGCIDVIRAFFATIGARLIDGIILRDDEPLESLKQAIASQSWLLHITNIGRGERI
ncbi:MAG: flavodoxin family protein [bacterium]